MDEYVSREEAVKKIKSCIMAANDAWDCGYNTAMAEMLEFIKQLPSADVQSVKHGQWTRIDDEYGHDYVCSVCNNKNDRKSHYCPDCGARMIELKPCNPRNTKEEKRNVEAREQCAECYRLIKEKCELLSKVSGSDVLRICQLEEQLQVEHDNSHCLEIELKEAKRILKMAVEDLSKMPCNNDTHSPDSCYICVKHGNCSYADSFKWCRADIALKLIGETNDEP